MLCMTSFSGNPSFLIWQCASSGYDFIPLASLVILEYVGNSRHVLRMLFNVDNVRARLNGEKVVPFHWLAQLWYAVRLPL